MPARCRAFDTSESINCVMIDQQVTLYCLLDACLIRSSGLCCFSGCYSGFSNSMSEPLSGNLGIQCKSYTSELISSGVSVNRHDATWRIVNNLDDNFDRYVCECEIFKQCSVGQHGGR